MLCLVLVQQVVVVGDGDAIYLSLLGQDQLL